MDLRRITDQTEHAALRPAGAGEDVDEKRPSQQLAPGVSLGSDSFRCRPCRSGGLSDVRYELLVPRHDLVALARRRGKHPVVRQHMPPRCRDHVRPLRAHLRGQSRQKRHWIHDHGGLAVAPGVSEAIDDVAASGDRQAILGERWAGDVTNASADCSAATTARRDD